MLVESQLEKVRVRDAAGCRAWLERVSADANGRLSSVDRLLRDLACAEEAPDVLLDIAEQARPLLLGDLAGVLERIDGVGLPMSEPDRQRLVAALGSLRRVRDLYAHLQDRIESTDSAARVRIPGAVDSVSAATPLVRALDAQARAILARQRLGVIVPTDEWASLCDLAARTRASTFMDVALTDKVPVLRHATARAMFVLPLLIHLARADTLTPVGYEFVSRLARRWAGSVGFRLEDSSPAGDERHGPSLALTGRHWVRLVTHRLAARLAARRRELDAGDSATVARLPRGLSSERARALLDALHARWVLPRSEARAPEFRLGEMRLRFGLPQLAPPPGARTGAAPVTWSSSASRAYVYGRFEQDTLIRRAMRGTPDTGGGLQLWVDGARAAAWVSIERLQSVFDVAVPVGAAVLDGLVLVVAPTIDCGSAGVGSGPVQRRMFGRVVSLAQRLSDDPSVPPLLRVGVLMWSARPTLVGVRAAGDPFFRDGFMLVPDPGSAEPLSVVAPASVLRPRVALSVREGLQDRRFMCAEVLDRGPGWERVRVSLAGG